MELPPIGTTHFPFQVCYGLNPLSPSDIISIPQEYKVCFEAKLMAYEMKRPHKEVRA